VRGGVPTPPHGRVPRLDLADGDIARSTTGTGGGWGDPFDREPERVREDVLDGYVTVATARAEYGVAFDPATLALDAAETARLRAEARP
jgi:N-methylhydantoinase B